MLALLLNRLTLVALVKLALEANKLVIVAVPVATKLVVEALATWRLVPVALVKVKFNTLKKLVHKVWKFANNPMVDEIVPVPRAKLFALAFRALRVVAEALVPNRFVIVALLPFRLVIVVLPIVPVPMLNPTAVRLTAERLVVLALTASRKVL
jgi:hypothetical protein